MKNEGSWPCPQATLIHSTTVDPISFRFILISNLKLRIASGFHATIM